MALADRTNGTRVPDGWHSRTGRMTLEDRTDGTPVPVNGTPVPPESLTANS